MAVNKRLLQGAAAAGGLVPSEHFGVVLYEGDGSTSHSINGGKFGAGGYFNTNGKVESSAISSQLLNDYSISFWLYLNNIGSLDGIMGFYTYNTNDGMSLVFANGNLLLNTGDNQAQYAPGSPIFSAGQWYHVVITLEDGGNMKLYIDGSLQTTISSINNSATSSSTLKFGLGSRTNSGLYSYNQYLNGKIDQARVFTKELSSAEVSTLYAETASTVESLDPLSEDTTDTLQVLGDSSCIATYRFENNEDDLSGNYNGTGTQIQYAAGRYGQAADFNGSGSEVEVSSNVLNINTISISAWIYLNTTSGYQQIVSNYATGNYGWGFRINDGGYLSYNTASNVIASSTVLSTNTWYHVALTIDSAGNSTKLYINGSEDSSTTYTAPSYSGNTNFHIGSLGNINVQYFSGKIDQVRIFNKALSASEVTTLYNENSLVASYRFEGNANDDTRNYDGTASNVTYEYGLNFTPDFVWIKDRGNAEQHILNDSTRGATKDLSTNTTAAEATRTTGFLSFDTGGFTLGSDGGGVVNDPLRGPYVAWCWKANGGTTSSNTDGTITSTVQANTQAGFSIVTWTASGVHTIGHGLGVVPEMIIVKRRSSTGVWITYHVGTDTTAPEDYYLQLNSSAARTYYTDIWQSTAPTSSVFTLYDSVSSQDYVAYAFHSVEGFSKFGSYTGNGSADGPIVETGFEPAFLMIKNASSTELGGASWLIYDNKRSTTNPRDRRLFADLDAAEAQNDNYDLDFLSNGFQIKSGTSNYGYNNNGDTYIYMAFAADPDTEAPAVAKSFSTVSYTGTGATQSITGLGFSPSLVWLKNDTYYETFVYDVVRGATKTLYADSTSAEQTLSGLTSFDNDGFTLGSNYFQNRNGDTYYAWAWKADDNEPTINTEGSIDSIVSANANAGFSIVKFQSHSTNATAFTVGHGLSAAPDLIIVKDLDNSVGWHVYSSALSTPAQSYLQLNSTAAVLTGNTNIWDNTAATSTVFSMKSGYAVTAGANCIAYCFHSVSGFSKIGSYTGNGSSNSITGLGFQPDWILIKDTGAAESWRLFDSVRNAPNTFLVDQGGAETTDYGFVSFDSDGFTLGNNWYGRVNQNAHNYIYMAFKIN